MTPIPYHLDWLASAIALVGVYFLGKKEWWAWFIPLGNLVPLTYINYHFHMWGFMPLNAILFVLYCKNLKLWYAGRRKCTGFETRS